MTLALLNALIFLAKGAKNVNKRTAFAQDRQIAAAAATQEDKNRVHFLQASQSAHANSAASSPPSLSPPRRDGLSAAPLATGKPPWASSTYLAHSSRSRIMLDAAMRSLPSTGRSLGSSLKQLQASPDAADKQRHGGSGILRRRSEGESPRIIRVRRRQLFTYLYRAILENEKTIYLF